MRTPALVLTIVLVALPATPAAAVASARPDLGVATLGRPAATPQPGRPVSVAVKVRNAGPHRAGTSTASLYLSRAAKHAKGDLRLASARIPALKPRTSTRRVLRGTLPAKMPPAT